MKGFGRGVAQRLVKTSIKRNLYKEEKEKTIEEAFNGVRLQKIKRRVMVYGTTSTKDVRSRLIEILFERVRYHKDKFISEMIYNELRSMTVKKSGKIEHSDNAHDDQVFSYLMALYVWYDGKNLANNWRIEKSTLKTDQSLELDEDPFEDALEAKEHVPIDNELYEEGSEGAKAIQWVVENSRIINSNKFKEHEHDIMEEMKNNILSNNKEAREKYSIQHGIEPTMFETPGSVTYVNLPMNIYTGYDDSDFTYDDEDMDFFNSNNIYDRSRVLQGNLSKIYDKL